MARKHEVDESKYIAPEEAVKRKQLNVSITDIALIVPRVVTHFDTSMVKQAQAKPDWKLYKIEIRDNVPYIVREMCDRCGKVRVPPRMRKLRCFVDKNIGEVYLETGICHDCSNASIYIDKYLDGKPLTESEAKAQFYKYAEQYERAWRLVLASAPRLAITEQEWKHRCKFFGGCAMCGGNIEVQARYFPTQFNGAHTSWNVIPLCDACYKQHYRARLDVTKNTRYRIFSTHEYFQKSKTIRMYLLAQMEVHNLYIEPLQEWRARFFETKILEGSK